MLEHRHRLGDIIGELPPEGCPVPFVKICARLRRLRKNAQNLHPRRQACEQVVQLSNASLVGRIARAVRPGVEQFLPTDRKSQHPEIEFAQAVQLRRKIGFAIGLGQQVLVQAEKVLRHGRNRRAVGKARSEDSRRNVRRSSGRVRHRIGLCLGDQQGADGLAPSRLGVAMPRGDRARSEFGGRQRPDGTRGVGNGQHKDKECRDKRYSFHDEVPFHALNRQYTAG